MKILFYGVREVEVPLFNELNKKFNHEIELIPDYLNSKETAEKAKGFECVVLRGNCFANKEVLDMYKSYGVKYLFTRTVGTNHIDVKYAKELGFKLAYVPFYSPNAIAELAVSMAMSLLRALPHTAVKFENRDFTVDPYMFAREIRNCNVGIIGLGKIGFTAAKLFKGLGANVLGYDMFPKEGIDDIVTQVSLDELVRNSDVISIHAPYIKENGKVITKEFLAKMKKNSILINTARGELMDLEAVIEALESGHLMGAGIDTIEGEVNYFFKNFSDKEVEFKLKFPTFQRLLDLYPRVLVTPHVGSYTDEAASNMIETSFENLKEYLETGACKNDIKG
ncbi:MULTISPECIES: 2-hydroxyacid dehydrogenase [Fusobacterium]|uniref:2-hydroxyacid dehydrogenase n=1 Tax=Fusobacterium TaxID=848 RepID=UPI001F4FCF6F|nr:MULTISPECIES: 2-hydroxyacid dehydrogenase [Fusobacterium]MDD7392047.1 2-hydroxyacid dehydrogenase [Fusobacteriaceae bacterium]MCI5724781.1 2-hydroxyacid dehydrogenase [Fusobacterium sp.]MCI7224356.1 2-hydroxyacid dehydrogenase [Fusobacterium sp.]MDD7410234.1 2-hydroxyacid dehydrogenase [Fusobacteriaceae bacterium]MDY5306498.1 2-hydroxyacid dehydrogenase [Fusobacterium gastrosuis]